MSFISDQTKMFKVIRSLESLPKVDLNTEEYSLDEFEEIENKLNNAKNQIDKYYQTHKEEYTKFSFALRRTNPIILDLKKRGFKAITRASLKLIELFNDYILPELSSKEPCAVFENGCFPCAFMKTFSDIYPNYEIYGSSLLSDNDVISLEDTYKIYQKNPGRFFMGNYSPNANGDMTNPKCILALANILKTCLGDRLRLYVSDASIGIGEDFNDQEKLNVRVGLGCIVCALMVLPKGAHAIFKFYTMFQAITINIVAILSSVFGEVIIVKPVSSGKNNSEHYLVCKHYKGTPGETLTLLVQKVALGNTSPMIARRDIPRDFLGDIKEFFEERCEEQTKEIVSNISEFETYLKNPKTFQKTKNEEHIKFAGVYMKKQNLIGIYPSNALSSK